MKKLATNKQKSYLDYVLRGEGLTLDVFTDKGLDQLMHDDVKDILEKIKVPTNPKLSDYRYVITYGNQEDGYIVGKQKSFTKKSEMNVICFMDLVVIDWDAPVVKVSVTGESNTGGKIMLLEDIKRHLEKFPYTFYIYETFNGFHGYIVSEKLFYGDYNTIKLMKELQCDPVYIGFTRKVGFVVRLEKKKGRDESFIERFVCQVNNYPVLPELQKLIDIKDELMNAQHSTN